MKNLISDLWNGNIASCEHCGAHNPEINRLHGMIEHSREKLRGGLSDEQQVLFQKYIDCSESYLFRLMELAFADGFSLGAKIMLEVF